MVINALISILVILIAIVAHEIAHGWAAYYLGDDTAKQAGRLSFNPLKHIDWFGTVILPLLLFFSKIGFIFGWAKPVPVDYSKLRTKHNIILTALAGSAANISLAIAAAILLQLWHILPSNYVLGLIGKFLLYTVFINLVLAVFNLLPIPPLDGAKILLLWSDKPWVQKYLKLENYGLTAIVILVFILPAFIQAMGGHFNPISDIIKTIISTIAAWII